MKYMVVGYYDDIWPMSWQEDTLDGSRQLQKELLEVFNIVKIFYNGEEVE